MNENDQDRIAVLEFQKGAKFDEICDLLAKELGFGEQSSLTDKERQQLVEEAEQLIDNWEEAAVSRNRDLEPTKGDFQRLLQELHDLHEQILDIRDDDAEDTLRRGAAH